MTAAKKSEKDRVVIFDTTLRDGEQCPGATMTFEEKLEVAEMLDDMGVDVIEAGFPITSEGDFQAVSEIARRSKNAVIAGLAACPSEDIDRCAEAVKFAKRGRVHTVIATSPLHMRVKLNMTPETGDRDVDCQRHARPQPDRRRRMVGRRRHPLRDGFPLPHRRGRHQGRRHHRQHPRHGRLHRAGGIHPLHAHADRAGAELRQGDLLGALPQRSRHGGGEFAGRCRRRRAPDRMHRQRHRRAGRQCRARRDRDGDQRAQRQVSVVEQDRHHDADARLQARLGGDLVSGAVQQGDRRPQRLCA